MFILDTESKIFQFNGANSNIQERAKALEVVQFLKDRNHEGKCDVAIVGKSRRYTNCSDPPPVYSQSLVFSIMFPHCNALSRRPFECTR